jgi:hypothetical protein
VFSYGPISHIFHPVADIFKSWIQPGRLPERRVPHHLPTGAAGTFIQACRVLLTNLTPGTSYTLQFRAIGGSTGYSDWSDPVAHMAM